MLQALANPSKSICPPCGFLWCCHCKANISSLSLPPVRTTRPFPAPLGCEGHTGPSQAFHHPRSWLLVFPCAAWAYSLTPAFPPAPGLLGPTESESLVTGASSCTTDPTVTGASSRTTDPTETVLLRCYPPRHPRWPSTAQRGGQSLLPACLHQPARRGGVSPAPPAARSVFSASSAVAAPA